MTLNIGAIYLALNKAREAKEDEINRKADEMASTTDDEGNSSVSTTDQMMLSKMINEWNIMTGTQTNVTKAIADGLRACYQNMK